MSKIRVAIVEDDESYLYSLKKYLNNQEDIEVTTTATNSNDALISIPIEPPDVVLMDINLNGNNNDGIILTDKLSKEYKIKSKIVMLTGLKNVELLSDSMIAGANKYLIKSDIEKIPPAIRDVMMDFNPDVELAKLYKKLKKDYESKKAMNELRKLTPQQLKHLKYVLEKKTRKQISGILGITAETVKNTINSIYKRLNITRDDIFKSFNVEYIDELIKEKETMNNK